MNRDELIKQYLDTSQELIINWKAKFAKIWAEEKLPPALVGVLFIVKRNPQISGGEVAQHLQVTKGAVAQAVEALFKQGLIARHIDSFDRRITHIMLTKNGEAKINKLEKSRYKLLKELTKDLSDKELEDLTELNAKLLANFNS